MENQKTSEVCETTKLKRLYEYLKIGSAAGFIFSVLIINTQWLKWIGACILVISTLILILVLPIIDWIDEGLEKNRFLNYFDTVVNVFLSIMLCILFYCVFIIPSLGDKPYYSIINKIGMVTFIFFLIKFVVLCIQKIVKEWGNDKSKFSVIARNILYFIFVLFSMGIALLNMYKSGTIVYVKDIKIPSKLQVLKVTEHISKNNFTGAVKIIDLEDAGLIDSIFDEINNKQYENVRGLDDFNNEFYNKNNYPYYEIIPVYDYYNNKGELGNLDSGYIYKLKLYSSGQIIMTDGKLIYAKLGRFFIPDYRIHLSEDVKKNLMNVIKASE